MSDGPNSADLRSQEAGLQPDAASEAVLGQAECRLFEAVGRPRRLAAGESLFRRGDAGATMYLLRDGRIHLDFGDDLLRRELGPGEFFGELGLLIGEHARSADAIAATACTLVELDHGSFDRLVERDPRLVARFLHRAIVRIVYNEQALTRRLRRDNEDLQAALAKLRDTTQQLSRTEELTRRDELTGLHNRRGCQEYIDRLLRGSDLEGYALLLVDCDAFKPVNDEHGHLAGDRVLQNVANILQSVAGQGDAACRLGGDEFALIVQSRETAELIRVGEFILQTARGLLQMQPSPPGICRLSIGACRLEPTHSDWNAWYGCADAALYQAKRAGGDRVVWHQPGHACA